jgi:SAM-dependent methyltransferase
MALRHAAVEAVERLTSRSAETKALREIFLCEVCDSRDLEPVLDLGSHPLCDDLIPVGSSETCKEYPIEILFCSRCKTAHQRFQVAKETLFPRSYHYRARHTADVLAGMAELVQSVEARVGALRGRLVLDIGCNDGSLLGIFAQHGARTTGIEPTGAAADALEAGHDVTRDFLTPASAAAYVAQHGQPDIVTFTNVFAHIDDLKALIESVRTLLHAGSWLVIENHYLGAILERDQFDTFYHEHPRTYSLGSFEHIGKALEMSLSSVSFPQRYGGNIRVIYGPAGSPDEKLAAKVSANEAEFGAGLLRMTGRVETWRRKKGDLLRSLADRHGPLPAKAFPGRSAISVKLLGLQNSELAAAYEKDTSAKVGHYVPGTRIPILADKEFDPVGRSAAPLINLAWHIGPEIRRYMRSRGFTGEIVDIISPEDFAGA